MPRQALILGLILLITLATFGRLFHAEFTSYDDPTTIEFNPDFNPPSLEKLLPAWINVGRHAPLGLYIPVTYNLWGLTAFVAYSETPDANGSHLNPWIYHGLNVVLHSLAAILVFELLHRLLRSDWPAAGGALLFAVHPIQVEAVAWASGTKDVLCGLLTIASLLIYLRAAQAVKPRDRVVWSMVWVLLVLLAMLAKPTGMIAPLLALTLDWTFLRRPWRQVLGSAGPGLLLMIPCAVWSHAAQPATHIMVAPRWARPVIALDNIYHDCTKILTPLHLAVDYGRKPLTVLADPHLCFRAGFGFGAIAIVVFLSRRHRKCLASLALFLIGIAPILGFVPFTFQQYSGVADHYLYLSMLGVALAAGLILQRLASPLTYSVAGAILLVLAALCFRQAGYWQHELDLWDHCIAVNPQSLLARTNDGAALFRSDRLAEAEQQFRAAVAIDDRDLDAQDNLALVLLSTARPAEAVEHLRRELELNDALPLDQREPIDGPQVLLGKALLATGDIVGARRAFDAALQANPNSPEAVEQLRRLEHLH